MSSSPTAADRSSAATCRHWATVRTEWSIFAPESHRGYHSRPASVSSSARAIERDWCTSTRS